MKPQTSLLLLLSAASLSLSTACSSSSSSKQETAQSTDSTQVVTVDAARLTELDSRQQYTAQLEAKTLNNITAQAGGRVKQILVAVGDRVAAGQVVARMEATQASAAQIQLADAKTNFARMDELYKVGGISKAQWEQAKSALEQAKLSYGNASENTLLRSPISGFVTAKNYDNGDVTSPTLPILVIGLPLGIALAASDRAQRLIRPLLDAMQTTPAFVYLVPVVMLFGIGNVPGVIVTIVFALPPLVRLTNLGIRQVRPDLIEAAHAYGASPMQMLLKVQLPLALPSIMAGINQALMLSLSMVVIASMIAVGGLGQMVLRGIGRLDMGLAAVGGLGIVLLAITLDRITQGMGQPRRGVRHWWQSGPAGLIARLFQR